MMHFIRLHIRVTSFLPWYFEMKWNEFFVVFSKCKIIALYPVKWWIKHDTPSWRQMIRLCTFLKGVSHASKNTNRWKWRNRLLVVLLSSSRQISGIP
jgi:hypothetical protein